MKVAIIGSGPAAAGVLIGLEKHAPDMSATIFDIGKVPDINPVHTRAPREWSEEEYDKLHAQIKSQFGFAFPPPKTYFGQGLRKHPAGPNAKPFISEFYGGLSRHWSASVFPFVAKDFEGWPVGLKEMSEYYSEISDEIGISGKRDELNSYFGEDFVNRPPIDIPGPIQKLNDRVNDRSGQSRGAYRIVSGLNRLAVETNGNAANSCVYCGECMYGCFRSSIYDATRTIERAKFNGQVSQIVNAKVSSVTSSEGTVSLKTSEGDFNSFAKVYLGAGCFGTSEIMMRTLGIDDGITVKDNNSYVFPIFYLGRASQNGNHDEYISITNTILACIPRDENGHYAHVHISPFADYYWRYYFPVGYWRYLKFFASKFKARMILAKMYFPTQISKSYSLSLQADRLKVQKKDYGPSDKYARMVLKQLRRVISGKGFLLPPVKLVRMSTSSHYVGAFPFSETRVPVKPTGEIMPNVYVADSSVFPESPAQTLTFTIMANAARTARESLDDK